MKEAEAFLKSNILWGKTLVTCGDSFTEGDFTGFSDSEGRSGKDSPLIYDSEMGVYKTYPWWIAKRNGMRLKNFAKCGGTIALSKKHLESPDAVPATDRSPLSHETYKTLGEADYILIMYGLNDMYNCSLGTIDDETNETFYGAFNVVYKYLITNYPMAKIGAIVSNAYLSDEYANAIRAVSRKWGIPYLDLMNDPALPATLYKKGMCKEAEEIRNARFFVTHDNHHPNHLAHEFISTVVEAFLRSL
jgi:lysophospholipase L1-like esterase